VAHQQHPGAEVGHDPLRETAPSAPPRWDQFRLQRNDRPILLAYAVVATMVLGLWRLSGGGEDETRTPWVRSAVQVAADGSVDVVQRITFASPRSALTVSIPARTNPSADFEPRIEALSLRVDGHPARGLERPLRTGETRDLTFSEPASSVVLSYSVEGAIVRTEPSAAGRALALATPLAFQGMGSMKGRLEIEQDGVLNVGCTPTGSPMTLCGSEVGRYWVVARGAGAPVVDVVAQVDLPEAARS
jgi:hypothetical protein